MIRTVCQKCSQPIEAGDEYAGQLIDCPHCGESVLFPDKPSPFSYTTAPSRPAPQGNNPELLNRLVPRKSVSIHYLFPLIILVVGGVLMFAGIGEAFIALFVYLGILGHLGAIASRLERIEELLRTRR